MLFAGIYTKGIVQYDFQIILGKTRNRYTLLRHDSDTMLDALSSTAYLTSSVIKREENIVSQIISKKTGQPLLEYGDQRIITAFTADMNVASNYGQLLRDNITETIDYEGEDFSIIVYHRNPNVNTFVNRSNTIEYRELKDTSKALANIKVSNVRTLSELKELYDLSWILNNDNTLKKDYRTICTEEELDWVINKVDNAKELAFDVETTGLKFFWMGGHREDADEIVGICLSWEENQGVYIPLESEKFECMPRDYVIPRLFPHLTRFGLDGANILFDLKVAYHYGYLFKCGFDTMQAEFDLDPTGSRGHKSLKAMTRYYIGDETLELDEVLGGSVDGRMIKYLDKDVITIYGCADADYVLKLKHIMSPLLNYMKTAAQLDFNMIPVCAITEYYSNHVDMNLLKIFSDVNKRDFEMVDRTLRTYLKTIATVNVSIEMAKKVFPSNDLSDSVRYLSNSPEVTELVEQLLTVEDSKHGRRQLNFNSTDDLDIIFFKILNYPPPKVKKRIGKKESSSKDDSYLISLTAHRSKDSNNFMKEDLLSSISEYNYSWVSDDDKILISKDAVNYCKYPFAIMLQQWRKLSKRQNSFYDRLEDLSCHGYYLTENKMTNADTARIINVAQTIQGYIKSLIIPFPNKYMIVFDAAQIEFRVMIGLASQYWDAFCNKLGPEFDDFKDKSINNVAEKLNIPWADYHREGGSLLVGKTPATMTKKDRSKVKGPHFAVPYGGSAYTIAASELNTMISEKEKKKKIEETDMLLSVWRDKMYPLYRFLESKRDEACTLIEDDSKLPPRLRGGKWGKVTNALGRCRYYNLDYEATARTFIKGEPDMVSKIISNKLSSDEPLTPREQKKWDSYVKETERVITALVRRSAGNYPIQSLAREYFVLMMTRLFSRLHKKGYMGMGSGNDKVILNMLVHDEGHLQVDYSIHPYEIYKDIIECCMLNLKGYPRIYCGISICHNWHDGKEDMYEAPVEFVYDMANAYQKNPDKFKNDDWKSNPQAYVHRDLVKWMHDYTVRFINENTYNNVFDLTKFRKTNENYFLFVKLSMYTNKFSNKEDDISKDELIILSHNENPNLIVHTESRDIVWSNYTFNYDKDKPKPNNNADTTEEFLDSLDNIELNGIGSFDLDIDDLSDSDYKESDAANCYWLNSEDNISEMIPSVSAVSSEFLESDEPETQEIMEYTRLLTISGVYCLDLNGLDENHLRLVSNYLKSHKCDTGMSVMYTYGYKKNMLKYKVSKLDIEELKYITENVRPN